MKLDNLKPFTNYTFRVMLFRVGGESGRGPPGPLAVIRTNCGSKCLVFEYNNDIKPKENYAVTDNI